MPQILGQDVPDAADLWRRLARIRGHRMAIAGVEHALWDLLDALAACHFRACWVVHAPRFRRA